MNIPSPALGAASGLLLIASGGLTTFTLIELLGSDPGVETRTQTQIMTVEREVMPDNPPPGGGLSGGHRPAT